MKKTVWIAVLLSMMSISALHVSAFSPEELNVEDSVLQEVADCLDITVDEQTKQNENMEVYGDIAEGQPGSLESFVPDGYDLNTLTEYYTLNLEKFISTGNLAESSADEPVYAISFYHGNTTGEAFLLRDVSGVMQFSDSQVYADSEPDYRDNFDKAKIAETLSAVEDVSDVRLYMDGWNHLNLVYFVSNGEEFVIPYCPAMFEEEYQTSNVIYSLAEYVDLLRNNSSTVENAEAAEGGVALMNQPVEVSETAPVQNTSGRFPLYAGGGVAVLGLLTFFLVRHR